MSNTQNKISLKTCLKWALGLFFFYLAVGWCLKGGIGIVAGILFLVAGLICIPPILALIEVKLGGRMSPALKYMIVIGMFILGLFLLGKFGAGTGKTVPVQTSSTT